MKSHRTLINSLVAIAVATGLIGATTVSAAGPAAVDLGSSGNFAVLAKSGISTTGTTSISGDIGVSPIAATGMTGFALIMDSSNTFSTSDRVTGKAYASDYAAPTPVKMTTAISDMETAYTNAAGRTLPTATELGAGNIGGMTLTPGLYKWSSDVTIPTNLTLNGSANDVWIFQIAQKLTVSSGARVNLTGGAQAGNIFWQVGGQATLGTTSVTNGNILGKTAIVLETGATLNGRALAQTAVTFDSNSVTRSTVAVAPTPPPAPAVNANTNTNTPAPANTNTPAVASAATNTNTNVSGTALPNSGVGSEARRDLAWPVVTIIAVIALAFVAVASKHFLRR